jgi:(E)-4-hydroxy-3-methylbut-2-enyl-diphosphate synthase
LVACPSCSRQNFDVISVVNELENRLEDITTPIDVAVIGCIVNGPGEAKVAEIGLTGASPANLAYVNGEPDHKISNEQLVDELEAMVRRRVAEKNSAQIKKDDNIIAIG